KGEGFKIKDEIYQITGPYSRNTHRVLLSLDLSDPITAQRKGKREDNDYPISWVKMHGAGRVFYSGFGHNNEIFWNPAILQHFLDGIQWALGDLEADATPSSKK
ncbi:glycosyl hydrolase, partial [bacterium E08(2017)]